MGVFEHFREHPGDRPYRRCPACGGELRMFRYSRRPGEIAFYCPGCDWNASVTDVDEARGVPSGGPLRRSRPCVLLPGGVWPCRHVTADAVVCRLVPDDAARG